MSAHAETDFEAMGLPDHSPFAILSRPAPAPYKPKAKKTRVHTLTAIKNAAPVFNTPISKQTDSDRNARIKGKL